MLVAGMGWCEDGVRVVDMTYDLGPNTVFWPGSPPFKFTILHRGNVSRPGTWYESNFFSTPEHGGTHVDAPAHFSKGSWRADRVPVNHLVGPAVVINVKAKAEANADYLLTVKDVDDWEAAHGMVPTRGIVLMNSGWASRYPNKTQVFNTATPNDPATFHFPGIHPNAATFLVTQRQVIAVGVDTPSTDFGQSTNFTTHVNLAKHNVMGLENVASLDELPARGFLVVIGLVKLVDGSGGPVRILAMVGEGLEELFGSGTGGGGHSGGAADLWLCLVVAVFSVGLGGGGAGARWW
ncbi:hypothetical protein ACOMHN_027930 [Nucella lapillus]